MPGYDINGAPDGSCPFWAFNFTHKVDFASGDVWNRHIDEVKRLHGAQADEELGLQESPGLLNLYSQFAAKFPNGAPLSALQRFLPGCDVMTTAEFYKAYGNVTY